MKELEKKDKDRVVVEKQSEVRKEIRHVTSFMPSKGHKLWELNPSIPHDDPSGWHSDIVQVEPERTLHLRPDGQILPGFATPLNSSNTTESTFKYKEGHLYCFALNKKNAIKRFEKMFKSFIKS